MRGIIRCRRRLAGCVAAIIVLAGAGDAPRAVARMDMTPPSEYGRLPQGLYALRDPHIFTHDAGLLTLQVTNIGLLGNPFINEFSAGWRGGEYLYTSGIWVGAIGATADPMVSSATSYEFRAKLDAEWTIYESFEGARGGNRIGLIDPREADDDHDGVVDEEFHNGLDDDGDGLVDEDFSAVGQQMFSCMYRDDTPEAVRQLSDHVPMGLLVRQRTFQWSHAGLDEFVGMEFEIINDGEQYLEDIYLGFLADADAGPRDAERYWMDDMVGWVRVDTTLSDPFRTGPCTESRIRVDGVAMWDAPDNGVSLTGGDVPGVFGTVLLGHPTDFFGVNAPYDVYLNTVRWFGASEKGTDPQNDDERYTLLSTGGRPWPASSGRPDDYRYLMASGPFPHLFPGESMKYQLAYVIGDGMDGFRANAAQAMRVFEGRWVNADLNDTTGIGGRETCLRVIPPAKVLMWTDPCDATVFPPPKPKPIKSLECVWVDNDCSLCSGSNGQESLARWVGTMAPPAPTCNTGTWLDYYQDLHGQLAVRPGQDRRVVLQWDNISELIPDAMTGEITFEGYRLWRVDNWQRPEGSIGPSPDEWIKIGEFRVHGRGSSDLGTFPLADVTRDVPPLGDTEDGQIIYPVGRYEFTDTLGITNGKVYFYAVTAFGVARAVNPVTGEWEDVELAGYPSAVEAEAVVPRWDTGRSCDDIGVVPNPYRGGAEWDLRPSERDPTGSKIAFTNLPEGKSTLRVYTLAGDLVQEVHHDGGDGDGTYYWNLISRNGQNVSSGIYIYSVEHPGGICRGRFVIIR